MTMMMMMCFCARALLLVCEMVPNEPPAADGEIRRVRLGRAAGRTVVVCVVLFFFFYTSSLFFFLLPGVSLFFLSSSSVVGEFPL